MLAFCLAIGFLAGCIFSMPLVRKVLHERTLKELGMEGMTIVPRFWTPSGLRIERARWQGEVFFEPAKIGGGHPGHLRLRAEFKRAAPAAPSSGDASPIQTGDPEFDRMIAVSGDRAFARKLLVPEMRERLVKLDQMGGRVIAIGEETVEIDGPFLGRPPELKRFLELCDAIVQGTVLAAGA
jgi:hypothetical protein